MKAIAVPPCAATGAAVPPIASGRVHRRADAGENAEIQMYLAKLRDLVPFMPKNRKISKLEVIQHVIDYICELQTALENHPEAAEFDAAAALGRATPPPPLEVAASRRPLTPANHHGTAGAQAAAALFHRQNHLQQQQQHLHSHNRSRHPMSPEKTQQDRPPSSC